MATKNIVPQNNNEGGIGTDAKRWAAGNFQKLKVAGFDVPASSLVRDYKLESTLAVNNRIAGLTGSVSTKQIFSSVSNNVYVRNTQAWFADLDLTCISAANSSGNWRVTAITSRHVLSEAHVGNLAGATVWFVDNNNAAYSRVLGSQQSIAGDLVMYALNTDLPSTITPALLLPTSLFSALQTGPTSFVGCPVLTHNQNQHCCIAVVSEIFNGSPLADVLSMPASSGIYGTWNRNSDISPAPANDNPTITQGVIVSGFPAITNDSTSPYFLILDNRLVLLGCFFGPGGSGPDPGANAVAIQAAIGSNYQLQFVNMPMSPGSIGAQGIQGIQGYTGFPGTNGTNGTNGAAATITVGTVTTGAPGSNATVTNSGTQNAAVLNFTIPSGVQGTGSATVSIGSVTALPAGSTPTVTNSGTSSNLILNFGLPLPVSGTSFVIESANFSCGIGDSVAVDTSNGPVVGTLPSSPSPGNRVTFVDAKSTWGVNVFAINPNGKKIHGSTNNLICDVSNSLGLLTYIDDNYGWS